MESEVLRAKHGILITLSQWQFISIVDILHEQCFKITVHVTQHDAKATDKSWIFTKISVCIKLHCIKDRENKLQDLRIAQ